MKIKFSALALAAILLLAAIGGQARAQTYTITNIGPLGNTWYRPYAVNDRGQAVGASHPASQYGWAFIYDASTGVRTLPAFAGSSWSQANAINHAGQVVGDCVTATSAYTGFLWDIDHGTRRIDQIADSNGVTAASLGWSVNRTKAINRSGDILFSSVSRYTPGIWRMRTDPTTGATTLTVTAVPFANSSLSFTDLNDNGVVLTRYLNPSTGLYPYCLWDSISGQYTTAIDPAFLQGCAMNNSGFAISKSGHISDPAGAITLLGSLGSGFCNPYDINDANQVVGISAGKVQGQYLAFLWENGVMKGLQSLTDAGANWRLDAAVGMSNKINLSAGYIVGNGLYKTQNVGWILTPK